MTVSVHSAVADIGRTDWDAAAAASGNPFVSYDFLNILEACAITAAKSSVAAVDF